MTRLTDTFGNGLRSSKGNLEVSFRYIPNNKETKTEGFKYFIRNIHTRLSEHSAYRLLINSIEIFSNYFR